jgi:capsular polysaccharide biosynthesis protein
MDKKSNYKIELEVRDLFLILMRRLWLIILVVVLSASGTYIVNKFLLTEYYTSASSVYVISKQEDSRMTFSDIQMSTQLTKDFMILVKSRPVTEEVIEKLGLDMTHSELASMIKVNTPQDTRILEIKVQNEDPLMAKNIADALAEASRERMVSIMGMEEVNIFEPASLPKYPSSPDILRNTALGGIIGGVVISLIIIIVNILNDSIKTSEDIETCLGISTLGIIPLEDEKIKEHRKQKHGSSEAAAII